MASQTLTVHVDTTRLVGVTRILQRVAEEFAATLADAATDLAALEDDEQEVDGWQGAVDLGRPEPSRMDDEICGDAYAGKVCTRPLGHVGRHLAYATTFVVAAWPGRHRPTFEDLDGPRAKDAEEADPGHLEDAAATEEAATGQPWTPWDDVAPAEAGEG